MNGNNSRLNASRFFQTIGLAYLLSYDFQFHQQSQKKTQSTKEKNYRVPSTEYPSTRVHIENENDKENDFCPAANSEILSRSLSFFLFYFFFNLFVFRNFFFRFVAVCFRFSFVSVILLPYIDINHMKSASNKDDRFFFFSHRLSLPPSSSRFQIIFFHSEFGNHIFHFLVAVVVVVARIVET